MLKGMYWVWQGKKFGNQIADFIGMHRDLYHGAMEEGGCKVHMLKLYQLKAEGYSVELAAYDSCKFLIPGLRTIEDKFGSQEQIEHARSCVMKLVASQCA
ncbi:hypothetical protein TO66_10605 [Pseudomonas sp. MRSN 12121]|nr:hypothetical protein TO66_10605 [Pseudomonas sp. MRSN 12121]